MQYDFPKRDEERKKKKNQKKKRKRKEKKQLATNLIQDFLQYKIFEDGLGHQCLSEEDDLFEESEDEEFEAQLAAFEQSLAQPRPKAAKLKPNLSGSWVKDLKEKLKEETTLMLKYQQRSA